MHISWCESTFAVHIFTQRTDVKTLMKKHIANMLTLCRVFGSIILLFLPVFSAKFYTVYILCGFSDMIDGTIARKTGSVGTFGARLDSVADIMFTAAASIRFLHVVHIPGWMWIWTAVIAGVRTISGIIGKKLTLPHTIPNKLTGSMLFLMPLTIGFIDIRYSGAAVCCAATYAALHETYSIKNRSCI